MGNWTVDEVRKLLEDFIERQESLLGVVTDVDEAECTCTVKDEDTEVFNVRLCPITEAASLVKVPAVGAYVLCLKIENSEDWMVVGCSEVAKIILNVGGQTLVIDQNGFVFNSGENGMVKIVELVSWLQKVYADLQTLQTLLKVSPVAGNGAPLAIVFSPTVPNPKVSDFEDAFIKH